MNLYISRLGLILFAAILLIGSQSSFAQLLPIKKFDCSQLEGKKLYVPTFQAAQPQLRKMAKQGKFKEMNDANEIAEYYSNVWKEAMAESSYDATEYEIRGFDSRRLIKNKDPEALLLSFYVDDYGNETALLTIAAPKKQVVARAIITGLDLSQKNDIRLMINMLNESLNTSCELDEQEEGKIKRKAYMNRYKKEFLAFYNSMSDRTFLVPESEHKKPKKAQERTADLVLALKEWKLSKYELIKQEEIEERRVEGDAESFYWKDFPIYTQNILITYHYNVILSTDGDAVVFVFLGKKRMKPSTLEKIQSKITAKAEKYTRQLEK